MANRAVFLIGASSDIFESSVSSILRTVETFDVDSITIFYSSFAKRYVSLIRNFFEENSILTHIKWENIELDENGYEEQLKSVLDHNTVFCPTAGSRYYTISGSVLAQSKGATIVHIMFLYGPWHGMYYPFVPRFLQQLKIMNGPLAPSKKIGNIITEEQAARLKKYWEDSFRSRSISRRAGREALSLNLNDTRNYLTNNDIVNLPILMSENGEVTIGKVQDEKTCLRLKISGNPQKCHVEYEDKGSFISIPDDENMRDGFIESFIGRALFGREKSRRPKKEKISFENLYSILGFTSLKASSIDHNKHSLEEISAGSRGIIVDTNLVYRGILLDKNVKKMIPYCTYVEIANKRTDLLKTKLESLDKFYADLLWESLTELMETSTIIPTETFFCDGVIPMIDPLLIKNCVLLTHDMGAYNHWLEIFSENTKVCRAFVSYTDNIVRLAFAFFLLASLLHMS